MRTHEVRDFSKRGDALPIPNLIEVQIVSYAKFLQKEVEAVLKKRVATQKPSDLPAGRPSSCWRVATSRRMSRNASERLA